MVNDQIKKDHGLTLGIKQEFQIVAAGFGPSKLCKAKREEPMKTTLLLYHKPGSPKPRLQNVPGSKITQHPREETPGCNCDRWGHPFPDCIEHNLHGRTSLLRTPTATMESKESL